MPTFDEFMEGFVYSPDTFNADEFKAAALAAHTEDITHVTETVAERDARINELDAKAKDLGSRLWDMQMKQGPKVPEPGKEPNPSGGNGDHTPKDVGSFFKKVER